MRYVAFLGLALVVLNMAACSSSSKPTATSGEGGTIYPGGEDDSPEDATVSPPTGPEHPANEADEGAPPVPADAMPAPVDGGSG